MSLQHSKILSFGLAIVEETLIKYMIQFYIVMYTYKILKALDMESFVSYL